MNTLTDNTDIEMAKSAVSRSIEKYQTDRAGLFAHDGVTPIFEPAVHAQKLDKALEIVVFAHDRAVAVADQVTQETEAARLAPFSDQTSALSAADLQDANARAVFIREDCETMALDDLAQRLRAVAAGGSKSSRFVHWRYAKARLDREFAKQSQDPALAMFAAVARELGVVGEKSGLSLEAQKRQEAAQSLKRWAGAQLAYAQTGKRPSTGQPMGI